MILISNLHRQLSLVDPSNNEPCKCEWRYTEDGERTRVSTKTGTIIPLPTDAYQLDDLTNPNLVPNGPKDTPQAIASKVTYDATQSTTFEEDICKHMGLEQNDDKRMPTYWY